MAIVKEERIGGQRGVLIYALTYPGMDSVRYVGKTVRSPRKRHDEHIKAAMNHPRLPVHRWIASLYRRGMWSCLWHLEWVPESEDWAARERHWIAKFRSEGHDLLNLTDGGEGLAGHSHSSAAREAIASKLRKGAWFNCGQCEAQFWRKPRDIKAGNNKFCSKPCYQASQAGVSKPMPLGATEAGRASSRAKKLAQTHCHQGHEFTEANTYINPRGARVCRECRKGNSHAFRIRNK